MNFASILPLFQIAANAVLTVLAAQGVVPATLAPLVAAISASILPLINSIRSGQATQTDVLAGYAAMIGTLNAIKSNTGLDTATLTKIEEYIQAAQDGTTAYVKAMNGFDGTTLVPVQPIP